MLRWLLNLICVVIPGFFASFAKANRSWHHPLTWESAKGLMNYIYRVPGGYAWEIVHNDKLISYGVAFFRDYRFDPIRTYRAAVDAHAAMSVNLMETLYSLQPACALCVQDPEPLSKDDFDMLKNATTAKLMTPEEMDDLEQDLFWHWKIISPRLLGRGEAAEDSVRDSIITMRAGLDRLEAHMNACDEDGVPLSNEDLDMLRFRATNGI